MNHPAPSPDQFLGTPYDPSEDEEASSTSLTLNGVFVPQQSPGNFVVDPGSIWQIPSDPMERIASALERMASGETFTAELVADSEPSESAREAWVRLEATKEKLRDQHEIISDLESDRQTLTQVIADVEEALGKSKAAPALAAKAVIDEWRSPTVPEALSHPDDGTDPQDFVPDGSATTYPGDPVEVTAAGLGVTQPPVPPAHDAPVEEWREYARALGHAGPGIDKANRSQIRTALGVAQPVEGGA